MNNEPVAIVKLGGDVEWLTDVLPYNAKLYPHPANLTDEEILEIAKECKAPWHSHAIDPMMFARAILRKAQEK